MSNKTNFRNLFEFKDNFFDNTIRTHGIKYMGSKKKLVKHIGDVVSVLGCKTAIDVFTGTTRVAQYLRQNGVKTFTSDLSWASTKYANTYVHNEDNKHLQQHINKMNDIEPVAGWLTKNYTGDVPESEIKGNGRCFRSKNTTKADAARDYIERLNLKNQWEKDTLVTAVIRALDSVDNTVGVQQAYLKEWCDRSNTNINFKLPECVTGPTAEHFEGNCLEIDYPTADLAYMDPPYSGHAYSTYYHLWDSVARWDKPNTSLKVNRRIDRVSGSDTYDDSMKSDWNNKEKAIHAFEKLINRMPVRYCLISYNNESIVDQEILVKSCENFGCVTLTEVDYKRNIMSQIGNSSKNNPCKNQKNKELLILIDKKKSR
jgi:adenine-specific DNA-methyltransferase